MLLCKAISLRSLIAKEMSQGFKVHIGMNTPIYTHTKKQATKKVIATGSLLRVIKYPVNLIFSATSFIKSVMADLWGEAVVLGIDKQSRKVTGEFEQLELGAGS